MLNKKTLALAAGLIAFGATAAQADDCHRDHTGGTVLGVIGGAAIGGAVTHGNAGGVIAGGILGGLAGNAIARDIDCDDRDYAERSYHDSFYGDVGRRYEWRHGRNRGYIVTTREYRRHGKLCRDFTQVVYRRGREYDRSGTACRRHGEWEII